MIWAQFETPHFTFDAFAKDRDSALALLFRAWNRHARAALADGAPEDVLTYLLRYQDDVQYREVRLGIVLMDGEPYQLKDEVTK